MIALKRRNEKQYNGLRLTGSGPWQHFAHAKAQAVRVEGLVIRDFADKLSVIIRAVAD